MSHDSCTIGVNYLTSKAHCQSQRPHQLERRVMVQWKAQLPYFPSTAPKRGRRMSILVVLAPLLSVGK